MPSSEALNAVLTVTLELPDGRTRTQLFAFFGDKESVDLYVPHFLNRLRSSGGTVVDYSVAKEEYDESFGTALTKLDVGIPELLELVRSKE